MSVVQEYGDPKWKQRMKGTFGQGIVNDVGNSFLLSTPQLDLSIE